jgi:hypothetical protein
MGALIDTMDAVIAVIAKTHSVEVVTFDMGFRACHALWRAFAGEDSGDSQGTSEVPVCKPHWPSE